MRHLGLALCLLGFASLGCKGLVVNSVANSLGGDGQLFASENDPELVREAIPFGLKTLEGLLEASPKNEKLLLSLASGFTQYAYAFVLQDAQMLEDVQPALAKGKYLRAKTLLQRAWQYGFRGLELRHKGFQKSFQEDCQAAMSQMERRDVGLMYWTAAALAAQISISKDEMAVLARLPEAEALLSRALELDEAYGDGALHELGMAYESRPESMGGNRARAQAHWDRVMAITQKGKIGPLVSWAESFAVSAQDRKEFNTLLDQAIAFDVNAFPRYRLVNILAQRRAHWLKSRVEDLFLEE